MNKTTRKNLWEDCISNKVGTPKSYGLESQNSLTRYVKSLTEINQGIVSFDTNKEKVAKDYLHLYLSGDLNMSLLNNLNTYFEVQHWATVHDSLMKDGVISKFYTKYFKENFSQIFRPDYMPRVKQVQEEEQEQVDLFDELFPEDQFEDVTFQTMKEDLAKANQEIEYLRDKVRSLSEDNDMYHEKLRQIKAFLNDGIEKVDMILGSEC